MARVNVNELLNTLSNIWVVEYRESEIGWVNGTWIEMFDSYEEAQKEFNDTNSENTSKDVSDYYIIAYKPKLFCDYYGVKLNK